MPQNITRPKFVDLRTNSLLKIKFNELPSIANASDISFWQLLLYEYFSKLRKFAQDSICHFKQCRDMTKHFH